ncbi:MAG: hypothetical protein CXT68_08960 [Methanobacteriota archaeon]|nr:MAG: hypothetical protein CXT68_08960 [Euryarchaeota archaeon]
MNPPRRFCDLNPSSEPKPKIDNRWNTHIVSGNGSYDWKPLETKTPVTWANLVRRVRGEA